MFIIIKQYNELNFIKCLFPALPNEGDDEKKVIERITQCKLFYE